MSVNPSLNALLARWREIAETLRIEGYTEGADIIKRRATELEDCLETEGTELLSGVQAEQECGYAADHLRRLVSRGELTNHGKKGAPRYRRSELPRKAQPTALDLRSPECSTNVTVTREQIARAVITAT